MHLGPVEPHQPLRRGWRGRTRPGRTTARPSARRGPARVIPPCSGWWANASALSARNASSSSPTAERAYVDPVAPSSAAGPAGRPGTGASPTGRGPGRSRGDAASAAAAGWLPCDQAVSGPGCGRGDRGEGAADALTARTPARRPGRGAPSCSQAKPSSPATHRLDDVQPVPQDASSAASSSGAAPSAALAASTTRRTAAAGPWSRDQSKSVGATRVTVLGEVMATTLESAGGRTR